MASAQTARYALSACYSLTSAAREQGIDRNLEDFVNETPIMLQGGSKYWICDTLLPATSESHRMKNYLSLRIVARSATGW
jgi:hypothetical protein